MTETVTVQDVEKTSSGWFEITLEDDERKLSTKSQELADAAFQSRGKEVEAAITSKVNGRFTNHYVNEIAGVKEARRRSNGGARAAAPRAAATPTTTGDISNAERQRIIQTEWAFGRAVELLMASGQEFTLPPDDALKGVLEQTAGYLLDRLK